MGHNKVAGNVKYFDVHT